MARYVRLQDGMPMEYRDMAEPPPAHKASLWTPVVDLGQPPHAVGETTERTESLINGQWVASYQVVRHSDETLINMIKQECQRRIIAITGVSDLIACVIKQSNANMRANELNDKRANGETLTAQEEAEAAALRSLAATIKALRARSNELEVSLPVDFTNDVHWA